MERVQQVALRRKVLLRWILVSALAPSITILKNKECNNLKKANHCNGGECDSSYCEIDQELRVVSEKKHVDSTL